MTDVEHLLAIEEIKKLKARYFQCFDTQDWDGFAAVFTEDAVMDMTEALQARDRATGRLVDPPVAGIAEYVAAHREEMCQRGVRNVVDWASRQVIGGSTVHHGHMPNIEITGPDTARGVWAMDDKVRFPPGRQPGEMHAFGHYHETYSREPDGWKISYTKLTRLRVDFI